MREEKRRNNATPNVAATKNKRPAVSFTLSCRLPSWIIIELPSVALMLSEAVSLLCGTRRSRSPGMLGTTRGQNESQTSEL